MINKIAKSKLQLAKTTLSLFLVNLGHVTSVTINTASLSKPFNNVFDWVLGCQTYGRSAFLL